MKTYRITVFQSLKSPIKGESDLTWEEVVQFFTSGHIKTERKDDLPLFNCTQFKTINEVAVGPSDGYWTNKSGQIRVRRKQINAKQVDMLIVDYDNGITIEEAMRRFGTYEYVGYTSYRHLYDGKTHKFRLIFPLSTPIPCSSGANEAIEQIEDGIFYRLEQSILKFAPGSDPSAYNGIQPFFPPSAPPERIEIAKSWSNQGKLLDWTDWDIESTTCSPQSSKNKATARGVKNFRLDPEQEFTHPAGMVTAAEVIGKIEKVTCPFHEDKKGSEFIVRHDSGVVSFTCKHCGTFSLAPVIEEEEEWQEQPLVEYSDVWWLHDDKDRMTSFLEEVKQKILSDSGKKPISRYQLQGRPATYEFKSHILYLPEGSGKSRLALSFLSDPPYQYFSDRPAKYHHQIIFASKSWDQAIEHYKSFKPTLDKIGRSGKVLMSFAAMIERRFGVKISRHDAYPFEVGKIKDEETIKEIVEKSKLSERFVRLVWNFLLIDKVRYSTYTHPDVESDAARLSDESLSNEFEYLDRSNELSPAIVFTTFAQLRLITAKKDRIPENWIIWLDDPDISDLIDIKRASESEKKRKPKKISGDQEYIPKTALINGTLYDLRDADSSLGAALSNHRCIYTTTERVTLRKLEDLLHKRKEAYEVHGERFRVTGGKITILGTKTVQKKNDALIPLYLRRVGSELKNDPILIADGIPSQFNHTTNKGRNDLTKRDILVEISYPHPSQIKIICDSMGLDFNNHRDQMTKELMLDKTHQAIGRNSGFRTNDGECVVLVDPKQHKFIVNECSYEVDSSNSVIIDRTAKMGRKETRLTNTASPFVKRIADYINNPSTYLSDGRKVKPDIRSVVSSMIDPNKVDEYLVRLLIALTPYSGSKFTEDPPISRQSKKIWDLGIWILNDLTPSSRRQRVLDGYTSEMDQNEQVHSA